MGLTDRMDGEIRLDEADLGSEPTFRRARAGIAMCRRARDHSGFLDSREHPDGLVRACRRQREIPPLVAELFPYLMDNLERNGGVLSGGQQQQLAIARALAAKSQDHPARRTERRHSALDRRGDRENHHPLNREIV